MALAPPGLEGAVSVLKTVFIFTTGRSPLEFRDALQEACCVYELGEDGPKLICRPHEFWPIVHSVDMTTVIIVSVAKRLRKIKQLTPKDM